MFIRDQFWYKINGYIEQKRIHLNIDKLSSNIFFIYFIFLHSKLKHIRTSRLSPITTYLIRSDIFEAAQIDQSQLFDISPLSLNKRLKINCLYTGSKRK